jgi:hypothetical protein
MKPYLKAKRACGVKASNKKAPPGKQEGLLKAKQERVELEGVATSSGKCGIRKSFETTP